MAGPPSQRSEGISAHIDAGSSLSSKATPRSSDNALDEPLTDHRPASTRSTEALVRQLVEQVRADSKIIKQDIRNVILDIVKSLSVSDDDILRKSDQERAALQQLKLSGARNVEKMLEYLSSDQIDEDVVSAFEQEFDLPIPPESRIESNRYIDSPDNALTKEVMNEDALRRDLDIVFEKHGISNSEKRDLLSRLYGIREYSELDHIRRHLPDSPHALALPDKAPKLYADREKGQTIVDFLRDPDGWGPYVAAGVLTRPDFRRLDPQGEMALRNWGRTHALPSDMRLPTRTELVGLAATDEERVRAARRLVRAHDRRRIGPSP